MKKIYSIIALGMIGSLAATAAVPVQQNLNSKESMEAQTVAVVDLVSQKSAKVKADGKRKKVTSVNDLVGSYSQSSVWALSGDAAEFSPKITAGDTPNQVFISNMPYSDVEYEGIVDFENQTLRINKQEAYYNSKYNEMVYLCFPGFGTEGTPINESVIATITDEGKIVFPEGAGIALKLLSMANNEGYFFGVVNLVLSPIKSFVYDASEWEEAGTAEFSDGWIATAFGEAPEDIPTNPVKVLKSNKTTGDFLLVNPYKDGSSWYPDMFAAQEGSVGDGYIRINIADPNCAYVYPLVGSGGYLGDANGLLEMYNFNIEGYKVTVKEYSTQEVIDELEMNFSEVSYYDADDKTAHFYNLYFGLGQDNMLGFYWWNPAEGGDPLFGETIVKFNFDPQAGVNDITVDENAPVKYFNLQGMEVAQPAKGQLVIKKQGSKSVKMIAE